MTPARILVVSFLLQALTLTAGCSPEPDRAADLLTVPETATFEMPLQEPAYVLYTEANVPHIYAQNEHDLRVVQGFVTARDRYFQIEVARRLGHGELSALIGDAALSQDQTARNQGMSFVANRILEQLTPTQEAMFQAYADGINVYIAAVVAGEVQPPSELSLLNLLTGKDIELLEPLTVRDLMGFVAVVVYQQGYETGDPLRSEIETRLESVYEALDTATDVPNTALRINGIRDDIWNPVAPVYPISTTPGYGLDTSEDSSDPSSAAITTPAAKPNAVFAETSAAKINTDTLKQLNHRNNLVETWLHGGRGVDFGSNMWAVMGDATEDGHAIIAGDGHLPLTVPSLLYQTGLNTSVLSGGTSPTQARNQLGLFFAGIPLLAVGTNGHVGWSITYAGVDITDWYREEIRLDADGEPSESFFQGVWQPLVTTDEVYQIARVPGLGSTARTETWARYATFDGRRLTAIEGVVIEDPENPDPAPGPGQSIVNVHGDYVIPADTNNDGVISGVSFDYTGFDITNVLTVLERFGDAERVHDMREASRRFVAFGQNVAAADTEGHVFYGGYSAMPCREHLPRNADGTWQEDADPRLLIDGTRFGGFQVPVNAQGLPDESDPDHCVVPFEQWPMALDPAKQYVANANNDLANLATDNSLSDDTWYLGGPFAPGYRAKTIDETLSAHIDDNPDPANPVNPINIAAMQALQADHHSSVALQLAPAMLQAITTANQASAQPPNTLTDAETRLRDLYVNQKTDFDEVQSRLQGWLDRQANAASGVTTFYHAPTTEDRKDATATMIFNAWFRQLFVTIFSDEGINCRGPAGPYNSACIWRQDPRFLRIGSMVRLLLGRGDTNPLGLSSWNADTNESIFFDDQTTTDVLEQSEEALLIALKDTLATLTATPNENSPGGTGGFGTDDMSKWLWGLRHQVKFNSLLSTYAGDIPLAAFLTNYAISTRRLPLDPNLGPDANNPGASTDPRSDLLWFPRPGDLFAVDAANPAFTGEDYVYTNGPVMRMVIQMEKDNIHGENILPGGQSGVLDSDHFDDQAQLWLKNQTLPMRFHLRDVLAGATQRESYYPRPKARGCSVSSTLSSTHTNTHTHTSAVLWWLGFLGISISISISISMGMGMGMRSRRAKRSNT